MTEQGKLLTPDVKAGDKILFGKYSGSEVKIEGEEHLILREDDILGVLEESPLRSHSAFQERSALKTVE